MQIEKVHRPSIKENFSIKEKSLRLEITFSHENFILKIKYRAHWPQTIKISKTKSKKKDIEKEKFTYTVVFLLYL